MRPQPLVFAEAPRLRVTAVALLPNGRPRSRPMLRLRLGEGDTEDTDADDMEGDDDDKILVGGPFGLFLFVVVVVETGIMLVSCSTTWGLPSASDGMS